MQKKIYMRLITEAQKALKVALLLNPRNHRYGSAVLTTEGNIYSSANYLSRTYSLSVHAEQGALIHAASHGEPLITAIAIISTEDPSGNNYCHPCGLCRQLIFENSKLSGKNIEILMVNQKGNFKREDIDILMPLPWPNTNLQTL
jgi:cytidine deaminase